MNYSIKSLMRLLMKSSKMKLLFIFILSSYFVLPIMSAETNSENLGCMVVQPEGSYSDCLNFVEPIESDNSESEGLTKKFLGASFLGSAFSHLTSMLYSTTLGGTNPNHIKPTNFNQNDITRLYNEWKSYLLREYTFSDGTVGNYIYYNLGGHSSPSNAVTVSEAHGYLMVISIMMKDFDVFDKAVTYLLHFRDPKGLMSWQQVQNGGVISVASGGDDSATDGDMDIIYALYIAAQYKQFRTNPEPVDSMALCLDWLNRFGQYCINTNLKSLLLGDWSSSGDSYYQVTRPSDFMLPHLRLFAQLNSPYQTLFQDVYNTIIQTILPSIQNPTTGLVPDFTKYSSGTWKVPTGTVLEGSTDKDYSYNSCRVPFRLYDDSPSIIQQHNRLNSFIKNKSGGNPDNIYGGYSLSGSALESYSDVSFSAPFIISAAISGDQAWLDTLYDYIVSERTTDMGYYDTSIRLMTLLTLDGRFNMDVGPEPTTPPPTTAPPTTAPPTTAPPTTAPPTTAPPTTAPPTTAPPTTAPPTTAPPTTAPPTTAPPTTAPPTTAPPTPTTNKMIFGYFPEWGLYDNFNVNNIRADKLTHIMYAFMVPNPNQQDFNTLSNNSPYVITPYDSSISEGTLVPFDSYAFDQNIVELVQLKANNPHIKVLLSVGGWTLSWHLSTLFKKQTARQTFVTTAVELLLQHGFDGIDIDWEYVGVQGASYNSYDPVQDPITFATLCQELRQEMDTRSPNKHLEITTAIGASAEVIPNYAQAIPYLDYFMLMTYDYSGSWTRNAEHHSGFHYHPQNPFGDNGYYVQASINKALEIGVSNEQLCIGTPFYGKGWASVTLNNPSTPLIFGTSDGRDAPTYGGSSGESLDYRLLVSELKSSSRFTQYYDDISKGHFMYDWTSKELWSYEDVESLQYKCEQILQQNLAGIIIWALDGDIRDANVNQNGLLDVINNVFNNPEPTTASPTTAPPTTAPPTTEPPTTAPPTTAPPTTAPPTTAPPTTAPPTTAPPTTAPPTTAPPTTAPPTTAPPTTAPPTTAPPVCSLQWEGCGGYDGVDQRCCDGLICVPHRRHAHCISQDALPNDYCERRWKQCGGSNWYGNTNCCAGLTCVKTDNIYSECRPI